MMATRIVRTCDRHGAKDIEVEANAVPIGLGTGWYSLDLCPECETDLLAELRAAVEEWGARIDGPQNAGKPPARKNAKTATLSAGGGKLPALLQGQRLGRRPAGGRPIHCFWCPLTYAGDGALNKHAHVEHGVAGNAKGIYGRQCPLCGEDGFDMLGSHIKRAHSEFAGTNQAFQAAADLGDPHGVVAKQIAQAAWMDGGLVIAPHGRAAATP